MYGWMRDEKFLHLLGLVRGEVISDHMDFFAARLVERNRPVTAH